MSLLLCLRRVQKALFLKAGRAVHQPLRRAPYPNTLPEEAKHTSSWLKEEWGVRRPPLPLPISVLTHFAFNEIASDVIYLATEARLSKTTGLLWLPMPDVTFRVLVSWM